MSRDFELLKLSQRNQISEPVRTFSRPQRPVSAADRQDWLRVVGVLQQYWKGSVVFAMLVVAVTAITVFSMKPVYAPIARIEVAPPGSEPFSMGGADTRGDPVQYLETETRKLQTDQLAIEVIRKLHLDESGDFLGAAAGQHAASKTVAADVDAGQSFTRLTAAESKALRILRSDLSVRHDAGSWLINVSYASHDPELAATITNALVKQYMDNNSEARHSAIVESTDWLSHQLDDIRVKMEESRRALADFQKTSGVLEVGPARSSFGEKISELNRQLGVAQAERIQLQALLAKTRGVEPASVPQVSAEPVVQELQKRLGSARAQVAEALVIYGKNHPNVRKLQAQVDDLEAQLAAEKRTIMSNMKTSYAAAREREYLLQAQLADNAKTLTQESQYEALKKEAEANESLYNSLYFKVKEAGIAAGSKPNNIRWVDHARVLTSPTRPQRGLLLSASVLAGLVGGVLLAFIRKALDVRLHTLDDLRDWTGAPNIVVLPRIGSSNAGSPLQWLPRSGTRPPEPFLLDRPLSPEAEALRSLFTSLQLHPSAPPQAILIASSFAGEGKTTVAVNLAIALSRQGRTCLVDADLRRPSVTKVFEVAAEKSLADVLSGKGKVDEALVAVPAVPNLTIMPAGDGSPFASELSDSRRTEATIQELRDRFDYIVIDTAPVLPYSDVRALSTMVDGIVFVGRSGITTREAIQRSLELLAEVHSAPVLHMVLNGVDLRSPDYRMYYGYDEKYGT